MTKSCHLNVTGLWSGVSEVGRAARLLVESFDALFSVAGYEYDVVIAIIKSGGVVYLK